MGCDEFGVVWYVGDVVLDDGVGVVEVFVDFGFG